MYMNNIYVHIKCKFLKLIFFRERASLWRPGQPGSHYVDQASLDTLTEIHPPLASECWDQCCEQQTLKFFSMITLTRVCLHSACLFEEIIFKAQDKVT